jgi:hypothetical protein
MFFCPSIECVTLKDKITYIQYCLTNSNGFFLVVNGQLWTITRVSKIEGKIFIDKR